MFVRVSVIRVLACLLQPSALYIFGLLIWKCGNCVFVCLATSNDLQDSDYCACVCLMLLVSVFAMAVIKFKSLMQSTTTTMGIKGKHTYTHTHIITLSIMAEKGICKERKKIYKPTNSHPVWRVDVMPLAGSFVVKLKLECICQHFFHYSRWTHHSHSYKCSNTPQHTHTQKKRSLFELSHFVGLVWWLMV